MKFELKTFGKEFQQTIEYVNFSNSLKQRLKNYRPVEFKYDAIKIPCFDLKF